MRYIRWFYEIGADDIGLVGGKGANLGEMARANFPVPAGFCVTATAYRDFMNTTGLDRSVNAILAEIRMDDPADVDTRTAEIRALFKSHPLPPDMTAEILESYRCLGLEWGAKETERIPV